LPQAGYRKIEDALEAYGIHRKNAQAIIKERVCKPFQLYQSMFQD